MALVPLARLKWLAPIFAAFLALVAMVWSHLPKEDPLEYFLFVDQRVFFGVPNTLDVLSNLGFLVAGLYGLKQWWTHRAQWPKDYLANGMIFILAVLLTAFGSSYFHWDPNPETLFWDRLPMTMAFSSLVTLLVLDRVDRRLGCAVAAIFIPAAALTVIGWGQGWLTLRPYIVLQFGSLVLILVISLAFRRGRISNRVVWAGLVFYVLAKVAEIFDAQIYEAVGVVSGHSLKHVLAAVAVGVLLSAFNLRENRRPRGGHGPCSIAS